MIYSDNGTTFVSAEIELHRLFNESSIAIIEISKALALEEVEWSYVPPKASHFDGLWEINVTPLTAEHRGSTSHLRETLDRHLPSGRFSQLKASERDQ